MRFRSEKDIYACLMSYCTLFCLTKNFTLTVFLNYGGEDLRHARVCVSGPETHVYAFLTCSPHTLIGNQFINLLVCLSNYGAVRPETCKNVHCRT